MWAAAATLARLQNRQCRFATSNPAFAPIRPSGHLPHFVEKGARRPPGSAVAGGSDRLRAEFGEIALERALVNQRQRLEIVEADPLVDRMDGGVDEAELNDRAGALDEAASEVPPPVDSAGLRPVTSSTPPAMRSVNGPGLVKKATALVGSKVSVAGPPRAAAIRRDLRLERFGRPKIVEADVEDEPNLGRNDVGGRIADVDAGDFEVRGLEVGVSLIERRRGERREQGCERRKSDSRRDADRRHGPGGRGSRACRSASRAGRA